MDNSKLKYPIYDTETYLHYNCKFILDSNVILRNTTIFTLLKIWLLKFDFKRLRTNINIVIDGLYIYFSGSSSPKTIS